ncbi:MAG TPA: caspase family protein [Blastocatellia bacterium]|nr:caspase family protein [Blastocatellia bacterium]
MRSRIVILLSLFVALLFASVALSSEPRTVQPQSKSSVFGSGQRWAVVIGISQYKFLPAEQQLKYASADAESFAAFLRTPEGGEFDDEHMKVLLDDNATGRGIRSALGTWLPSKVQESDTVIIYFAGHGIVEDVQGGAYLAPADTEPQDLYATAIQLDAVSALLQKRIPARQVVLLADASHVNHLGRVIVEDKDRTNNIVNTLIGRMSGERLGVYTITANRPGEPSKDSDKFNHGVFTYYLLQALKGSADYNTDYIVRADEAYQYVAQAVGRETEGTQHPQQTGRFGNRLALAQLSGSSRATEGVVASNTETSKSSSDRTEVTKNDDRSSGTKVETKTENKDESSSTARNNRNNNSVKNKPSESSNSKPKSDTNAPPSISVGANSRVPGPGSNMPKTEPTTEIAPPPLSPAMASFNLAIETGSLVEPRGKSAWDMYLNMVKGDPNRSDLQPIKSKLADALASEGDRIMDKQKDPAQLDLSLEDYQKASAVFAKAYQLRPDNQHLNAMQQVSEGRALTLLQRFDEAQKTLQHATELDPNSAAAHMALGIAFREQQRFFLAERELKRAIELQGDWFLPHYNLGLTYEAGKSEDDAIREYTAALSLNDKQPAIFARLGLLYLGQKKYSAAAAALEKSLALKPDSELYNKLGNAYFGMGKQEEASKAYRMAREARKP